MSAGTEKGQLSLGYGQKIKMEVEFFKQEIYSNILL